MLDWKDGDENGVRCPACHYGKYDHDHSCKTCDGHGTATPEAADAYVRGWAEFHLKHLIEFAEKNNLRHLIDFEKEEDTNATNE
jgi:hypothetical protein